MKFRNKIICLALVLLMVVPILAMATSANTATAATIKSVELTLKKKNGSDIPAQYGSVAGITDGDAFDSTRDANDSWPYFYSDWVKNSNIFYYLDQDGKFTESATDENNKYRAYLVIELNDVSKLSDMTIWLGADGSTAENAGAWSNPKLNWNMNEAYDILGSMDGETWVVLDEFDKMCGNKTEKGENFPSEGDAHYASKTVDGYLRLGHKIDMKDQTMRYISVAVKKGNNETHNQTGEELHAIFFGEITINGEVADASALDYRFAKDGDLLYQLDFNGTAGTFVPGDANGAGWNYSNFAPSADGKSATFNFTTSNEAGENKSRARFSGKFENYTLAGNSYTVEFTLNSTAPVGIALDGGGGFVIQPTTNSTWIGRYGSWAKIGKLEIYEGSFEQIQTYAIEISFPTTTATNYNNIEAYNPTVYRLFVKNAEGTWDLVREVPVDATIQFDFEAAYGYLDFAAIRYNDNFKTDADGNPTTSTVSDVKLYKGIDFIPKSVAETPEDTEPEDTEPTDTQPTDTQPTDTQPTTPPETFAPPKPVTDAPTETSGDTGAAEESGCASLISGAGIVAAVTGVAALAFASKKRKED